MRFRLFPIIALLFLGWLEPTLFAIVLLSTCFFSVTAGGVC
jgi:hypothetical protein